MIGGESSAVYRRVIERANGWYGFGLDLDGAAHAIAELHDAAQRYSRPLALEELEISITPVGPLSRETVARFADLGYISSSSAPGPDASVIFHTSGSFVLTTAIIRPNRVY